MLLWLLLLLLWLRMRLWQHIIVLGERRCSEICCVDARGTAVLPATSTATAIAFAATAVHVRRQL